MDITIIGGGNMGGALAKGWRKALPGAGITVTAHSQATLDRLNADCPGLRTSLDNVEAVKQAGDGGDRPVIVLCIKPWLVDSVISEIFPVANGKMIISVAANARNEAIDVYAMPNIAAEYGESVTFIEDNRNMGDISVAQRLFDSVGITKVVRREQMAAGMMMSGCGIAYVMRYLRALVAGGVELGFPAEEAKEIAMQTMAGAVRLLRETGLHPEHAIDRVSTPGGITIKGLNELEHAGFSSAVIRGLKAGFSGGE